MLAKWLEQPVEGIAKTMIEEHPEFVAPPNLNVRICRYLDFTKFGALLESRALFFSRLDKLGDPFEGSWQVPNVSTRVEMFRQAFLSANLKPD
jgi:hypothetical protein